MTIAIATLIEQTALAMLQSGTPQGVVFPDVPAASILARKLPKISETIDLLPAIILAGAEEPEEWELTDFEGSTQLVYPFEICRIAPVNADQSPDNNVRLFRQIVRQIFYPQDILLAPTVWTIELKPGHLYDRAALNQQYSFSSMVVRFLSQESFG